MDHLREPAAMIDLIFNVFAGIGIYATAMWVYGKVRNRKK